MTLMTREEMYELHGLLHRLWSKAQGREAYDKKEWMRLEALTGNAISAILGPEAERVGYMNLITPAVQDSSGGPKP
jgi:hypothetical protein